MDVNPKQNWVKPRGYVGRVLMHDYIIPVLVKTAPQSTHNVFTAAQGNLCPS